MLSDLPREQLVLLGSTVSARRMIDQARYTLGQVSIDVAMQSRLGKPFLAEAQAAVDALEAALRDRFGARSASANATVSQKHLMHEARRYRRGFAREMRSARRRGVALPPHASVIGRHTFDPGVLAQDLDRLLSAALPVSGALAGVGITASFLKEGQDLVVRLRASEKEQEMAKRTLQRAAVARKRELTGLVHEAIETIVDAASAVHRDNHVAAKEYNLDLLRGSHAVHEPQGQAPAVTPTPAVSPPSDAAA